MKQMKRLIGLFSTEPETLSLQEVYKTDNVQPPISGNWIEQLCIFDEILRDHNDLSSIFPQPKKSDLQQGGETSQGAT